MMNKAKLIGTIIVLMLMTVMTYLVVDSERGRLFFSGGSIGSTMRFFGPNLWIVLILYIGALLSVVFLKRSPKFLLSVFVTLFVLWFISGRTIGVHWTGEITTGWFYINTGKVVLSGDGGECSEDLIGCTEAKNSFPFCIVLTNSAIEKEIFVGPVIRPDVERYFNRN